MVFFWVIDNLIMRKQEARVGEYRQLEEDTDEPLMEPLDMGRSNVARRGSVGSAVS